MFLNGEARPDRDRGTQVNRGSVASALESEFPTMPLEHIPNSGLFGNAQGNVGCKKMRFHPYRMSPTGAVATAYFAFVGVHLILFCVIGEKSVFKFVMNPGDATWVWWPLSEFAPTRCRCSRWFEHLIGLHGFLIPPLLVANGYIWGAILSRAWRHGRKLWKRKRYKGTQPSIAR